MMKSLYINFFSGNRKLSSSEVVEYAGFGKTKVVKLLKSLVDQSFIKVEGRVCGTKYTL